MDRALQDDEWRDQLSKHAMLRAADFSWDKTAQFALSAIEQNFESKSQNALGSPSAGPIAREKIAEAIVACGAGISLGAQKLELIAQCLAANLKVGREDTLFLDVTELAKIDGKTGIQRVVRALLLAINQGHARGLHVQPIFFDGHRFRSANSFSNLFLGRDVSGDHLIDFGGGDHYLSLDLNVASIEASEPILKEMQRRGVNLNFLVYDVLPLMHPEWWPAGLADGFASWFAAVSHLADRLICISRAVRDDVAVQLELHAINKTGALKLGWFHLGADIKNTSPSVHLPRDADDFFGRIVNQTTFLMVGTVEPRKGHALALDAFSKLWRDGYDFNLVVIGKKGWLVDDLADRMSACSKNGSAFYWFQGASDEFLERAYLNCSCLLAASEAEGFGLPLIEASFHSLPVLARDIAVFREVAGNAALYFDGGSSEGLVEGVLRWVRQKELNAIPEPAGMDTMSWQQSANALLDQLEI
jgi:glycosyltransferase involved in cell wall biosynthesis